MNRRIILLCFLLSCCLGEDGFANQYAFQVNFTDKNNTVYSLGDPLAYLSARALARRSVQGISVDSSDLPVNAAYIDSVLTLTGGIFHESSRWLNLCVILLDAADSSQILQLAGKPYIKGILQVGYFSPNLHGRQTGSVPQPVDFAPMRTSSGDADYYGYAFAQTQIVNGNYLHDQGYDGQGKLIAVFDDGFVGATANPGYDSLWTSGRVVDTFDFTFHNTNVLTQGGHGAQVLSTMAGYLPGASGYVGTAPKAMYALYLTEYDPYDLPLAQLNMICAAERADSVGADVITESLGYDLMYNPANGQSYPQTFDSLDGKTTIGAKAANIATKKGILFVATCGNDGTYVSGWGTHVMTPGDADSALTIGAVDFTGAAAPFSGYGPNAAGVVKPDVCAVGSGLNGGSGVGGAWLLNPGGPGFIQLPGTSFSTPQVAGWAACLMQANPTARPARIRQAIRECASLYPSSGAQLGYGVANFECAQIVLGVPNPVPPVTTDWVIANPNPLINDQLHLSVSPDANQDVAFTLTDMTGKEVFSFSRYMYRANGTSVDVAIPELPPGIYVLRVVSATQQEVLKLEVR